MDLVKVYIDPGCNEHKLNIIEFLTVNKDAIPHTLHVEHNAIVMSGRLLGLEGIRGDIFAEVVASLLGMQHMQPRAVCSHNVVRLAMRIAYMHIDIESKIELTIDTDTLEFAALHNTLIPEVIRLLIRNNCTMQVAGEMFAKVSMLSFHQIAPYIQFLPFDVCHTRRSIISSIKQSVSSLLTAVGIYYTKEYDEKELLRYTTSIFTSTHAYDIAGVFVSDVDMRPIVLVCVAHSDTKDIRIALIPQSTPAATIIYVNDATVYISTGLELDCFVTVLNPMQLLQHVNGEQIYPVFYIDSDSQKHIKTPITALEYLRQSGECISVNTMDWLKCVSYRYRKLAGNAEITISRIDAVTQLQVCGTVSTDTTTLQTLYDTKELRKCPELTSGAYGVYTQTTIRFVTGKEIALQNFVQLKKAPDVGAKLTQCIKCITDKQYIQKGYTMHDVILPKRAITRLTTCLKAKLHEQHPLLDGETIKAAVRLYTSKREADHSEANIRVYLFGVVCGYTKANMCTYRSAHDTMEVTQDIKDFLWETDQDEFFRYQVGPCLPTKRFVLDSEDTLMYSSSQSTLFEKLCATYSIKPILFYGCDDTLTAVVDKSFQYNTLFRTDSGVVIQTTKGTLAIFCSHDDATATLHNVMQFMHALSTKARRIITPDKLLMHIHDGFHTTSTIIYPAHERIIAKIKDPTLLPNISMLQKIFDEETHMLLGHEWLYNVGSKQIKGRTMISLD